MIGKRIMYVAIFLIVFYNSLGGSDIYFCIAYAVLFSTGLVIDIIEDIIEKK